MQTIINGKKYNLPADNISALDFLRNLGITSPKKACNTGVCGACAINVDGKTVNSCVLPAVRLENKKVTTLESIDQSAMHPIQKAFIQNDALQCGFCTPGFVTEAINFYDTWTQSKAPNREEIAEALSGHLCRCAAYQNIYNAVQEAFAGKFDGNDYDQPRYDAVIKVTGQAKYTTDIILDDQISGFILRSSIPSGIVKKLNYVKAEKVSGIAAIEPFAQVGDKVRYVGTELLAIAYETKEALDQALTLIDVEIEEQDFVIDGEAAISKNAPLVYTSHEHDKIHDASEGFLVPGKWKNNIRRALTPASLFKGKATKILKNAQTDKNNIYIENIFETSAQVHTALEPHVCVAKYDAKTKKYEVYLSTQGVYDAAERLAAKLSIKKDDIKVIANYIGGGFGSKLELSSESIAACKLSKKAGKPVKVEFSREEDFIVGGYRPASKTTIKIAADKNKKLQAISAECYSYSGVGAGYISVDYIKHAYGKVPKALVDYEVMTNVAPSKPFRAPGASRIFYALESSIDDVATKLKADPIDFRLANSEHQNKIELLKVAKETALWKKRNTKTPTGRFVKGVGVAATLWPYWYSNDASIELIARKNKLIVKSAVQDIGTGSRTVIINAIKEVFPTFDEKNIELQIGNSSYPKNVTSGGSMTTPSTYYTVLSTCMQLKEELGEDINTALANLTTEIKISEERGSDKPFDNTLLNFVLGKNTSANVVISEVEVDTLLSRFKVTNVWSGVAAGKIVNKKLAENQVHGGIIQGIGYALYEEKTVNNETGQVITTNLENYKIPGIGDIPQMETYFYEKGFEHVKGEAIGLAEVVTVPIAGSVANAIFNATGKRYTKLPINYRNIGNI